MERREYVIAQEAYYFDRLSDTIKEPAVYLLSDGRDIWVVWKELTRKQRAPCIQAFDDAWSLFATWADVWAALAALEKPSHKTSVTVAEFCAMLNTRGFTDVTPRQPPPESGAQSGAGG